MYTAYILMITSPEHEHEVYNKLMKSNVVEEIFPLFGEWDLIAKTTGESNEEIADKIIENIRPIKGILSTKTMMGY